jgi:hypothetical protein
MNHELSDEKRPRGRPRKHETAADRQRAYRERLQHSPQLIECERKTILTLLGAAQTIIEQVQKGEKADGVLKTANGHLEAAKRMLDGHA